MHIVLFSILQMEQYCLFPPATRSAHPPSTMSQINPEELLSITTLVIQSSEYTRHYSNNTITHTHTWLQLTSLIQTWSLLHLCEKCIHQSPLHLFSSYEVFLNFFTSSISIKLTTQQTFINRSSQTQLLFKLDITLSTGQTLSIKRKHTIHNFS